jgi:hypothetical protein
VLPDSHPVWSDVEQPAPIDVEDRVGPIRPIGWLMSGTAVDGIVRVVNHGVDHSGATPVGENPLYCRFGYSTVTAPVPLPGGSDGEAVDNQVALVDEKGRWSQRPLIDLVTIDGHRAESRHLARFARTGPEEGYDACHELTCVSLVRGPVEVRAVRIEKAVRAKALVISGYAVPREPAPGAPKNLVSAVAPMTDGAASGRAVHPLKNAFGADLEVPWCRFDEPEPDRWYVVAIGLGTCTPNWPAIEVGAAERPKVIWPDGAIDDI